MPSDPFSCYVSLKNTYASWYFPNVTIPTTFYWTQLHRRHSDLLFLYSANYVYKSCHWGKLSLNGVSVLAAAPVNGCHCVKVSASVCFLSVGVYHEAWQKGTWFGIFLGWIVWMLQFWSKHIHWWHVKQLAHRDATHPVLPNQFPMTATTQGHTADCSRPFSTHRPQYR